jgi:hypothetical protein
MEHVLAVERSASLTCDPGARQPPRGLEPLRRHLAAARQTPAALAETSTEVER